MKQSFKKEILQIAGLYTVKFVKNPELPFVLFVHGGPGMNCGILEYLIEHHDLFGGLDYNLVLYDQRTCGRSTRFSENVYHKDNVNDLNKLQTTLRDGEGIKVKSIMGHSYGAKLLYDFYLTFKSELPAVFISTADTILTPRLNNLLIDLFYLKTNDQQAYQNIIEGMSDLNVESLWKLTDKVASVFKKNPNRPYFYWANLKWFERVQKAQKQLNLPVNQDTFTSVRKDLYSNTANFNVDIINLDIPFLWVNGLQDFVMNGSRGFVSISHIQCFTMSAHYPHIEENKLFCKTVNAHLKNL